MTILQTEHSVAGSLLKTILAQARGRGWRQMELARRASVPASSISRIKRTGRADLDTLGRLAAAVGLKLDLVPDIAHVDKVRRGDLF